MEVLCAAFEPLTTYMLRSVFHWRPYEYKEVVKEVGALFSISDDSTIRPFHSSVLDWVMDEKTAGDFYADPSKGHERLGKWAAAEYEAVAKVKNNDFVQLK